MARFLAGWLWLMVVIDFTALSTAMNGPDKSLWLKFLNFKKWKHRNDNRYEQVQNQLSEFRFGGQTGPNGNQSPSGPAASGAIGPAGSVGGTRSQSYQGPTGSKLGLTGSSGLLRQSGPSGYSGPAGSSGQLGSPGLQGPLGLAGMKKFPRLLQLDALPVGQGSALVLQCPNKDITIIDLGSAEKKKTIFWSTTEIKDFFRERFHLIKNIVITHNHDDHYSLFSKVFNSSDDLPGLINIYISLTPEDMPGILRNWTIDINATDKIRMFNGGQACGISNETPCDIITLCEEDPDIKTLVLSANAANFPKKDKSKTAKTKNNKLKNDKTKNDITKNDERRKDKMKQVTEQTKEEKPNVNSIVIGITFKTFTMLLDGDFEDCSARQKNGPLDKMADILDKNNYPRFTVYMLAHHGAGRCANKPHLLDVVQPKAVFVSANPWSTYRHPNCTVIEHLTKYLCQPGEIDENSPFYCGQHPMGSIDHVDKLQTEYTCGLNIEKEVTNAPEPMRRRKVTDNTFAIYSTTPLKDTINRVHLVTDGDKWGFINNIKKPKNP